MELRIGENIRKLRKERGLTQEQLAEALGITVGAVHKWESYQSMPEIRLLVELAEMFETSVDSLLGYGWEKGTMAQAAEKIRQFTLEKNIREGLRFAERALKKYPNSFEVVYRSAELYYLAMSVQEHDYARRAMELYRDAIRLIDQNPYPNVSLASIENGIAGCYCYLNMLDEAVALFQKNNVDGQNEYLIGQILAKIPERADEALYHLSNALGCCYSQLCNICMGYVDAYSTKEAYAQLEKLLHWFYELSQGLRDTGRSHYMDRMDICVFVVLAAIGMKRGDLAEARACLQRARALALRFDENPSYEIRNIYFYHGSETVKAYDDMGETAVEVVVNAMQTYHVYEQLQSIWEELCHEE